MRRQEGAQRSTQPPVPALLRLPAAGVFARLLRLLAPDSCLHCGRLGAAADRFGLCQGCRGRLVRAPTNGCNLCGRPLAAADPPPDLRCGRCREPAGQQAAPSRVIAPWSYAPPLDSVLRAYKFRRLAYLGPALGRGLAAELGTRGSADGGPLDLVAAVPLHWRRRVERGFDQAALLATAVATAQRLPHLAALVRQRATARQSDEDRATRLRNLRAAFGVPDPAAVRGRRVLLIDDVVTTGATLAAAARALLDAGAVAVVAAAVARTPPPAAPGAPGPRR